MDNKEELFEGISIMSPQDMEDSLSNETMEDENEETIEVSNEPVITATEVEEETEEVEISNESSNDNSRIYSAIIKDMMDEGVILGPQEEDELKELLKDASPETIKKLMSGTLEKAFQNQTQNWKNSFSGAKRKFLEIEDAFGKADDAIQVAQRLEFFDNITEEALEEDENLQKNIYFDYLKRKGFSDEEASEAIEEADSIDKLKEKAMKAVPYLREDAQKIVEQSRQMKRAEQNKVIAEYQERYTNLMNSIDERESFIDGLKLNKVSKDKLKDNISRPVYKDKQTGQEYTSLLYKQMRNPVEFEMLINYYDSIGLFNIDNSGKFKPDISKIKNVAKTKAVSELERIVSEEDQRGIGRNTSNRGSEKTQNVLNFLEQAYSKKRK